MEVKAVTRDVPNITTEEIRSLKDFSSPEKVRKPGKNATIVLIHKKGIESYRTINLLSVIHKLFSIVHVGHSSNQLREQAGNSSGFSKTDHIHTLTQIREKINEYREPLCMAFIDYKKAFDSILVFCPPTPPAKTSP
ncbi:uncharacterized protein [Penaeus vannamei]|uniref:uncharacterized protein n=1 Tax=Penaeus vannamei TaxID=6689 RepID=UPI00387F9FC6